MCSVHDISTPIEDFAWPCLHQFSMLHDTKDLSLMNQSQYDVHDRFGVPKENLLAAERAVQKYRNLELSCYVPSRKEIVESDKSTLTATLTAWLCKSPLEIIPSSFQVDQVLALLAQRTDYHELKTLVTMCQHYPRHR